MLDAGAHRIHHALAKAGCWHIDSAQIGEAMSLRDCIEKTNAAEEEYLQLLWKIAIVDISFGVIQPSSPGEPGWWLSPRVRR